MSPRCEDFSARACDTCGRRFHAIGALGSYVRECDACRLPDRDGPCPCGGAE